MKELKFSSTEEALQHLADVTGKQVKIAAEPKGDSDADRYNWAADEMEKVIKNLHDSENILRDLAKTWHDFDSPHSEFEADRKATFDKIAEARAKAIKFFEEVDERAGKNWGQDGY